MSRPGRSNSREASRPRPRESGPLYERIYAVVGQIPAGRVATYGQVAAIVGRCTPRLVGYAMAAVPPGSGVPWHRVINSRGEISLRPGHGGEIQRGLLEAEGVTFDDRGRVDLDRHRWPGPVGGAPGGRG
jgi:methylated-DNA-protein-cysteine methyltransferase-like protein